MSRLYKQVMVMTTENVKKSVDCTLIVFSIILINPVRVSRQLLRSVVRELLKAKGSDESTDADLWDRHIEANGQKPCG
jgi:heme exporter protein D